MEHLLAVTHGPAEAIQTLTKFGCSGADRFTELNFYAGLAAIDNSAHHFSTLARSNSLDDLLEFQLQSLLPTAESAKVYVGQVIAFAAATSRGYWRLIEGQMSDIQNKAYDDLYDGLTHADKDGNFAVKLAQDTLTLTREAAMSIQSSIWRNLYDTLDLQSSKNGDEEPLLRH